MHNNEYLLHSTILLISMGTPWESSRDFVDGISHGG